MGEIIAHLEKHVLFFCTETIYTPYFIIIKYAVIRRSMDLWKILPYIWLMSFVLYYTVLKGWSLLPNALRPFQIYCALPNLGITRTWICRLNFAQRPIFSSLRFFNEPEISDSGPQLKVPPGGLVLKIFTSWKNPSPSADGTCKPWISRRARYPETTEADINELSFPSLSIFILFP